MRGVRGRGPWNSWRIHDGAPRLDVIRRQEGAANAMSDVQEGMIHRGLHKSQGAPYTHKHTHMHAQVSEVGLGRCMSPPQQPHVECFGVPVRFACTGRREEMACFLQTWMPENPHPSQSQGLHSLGILKRKPVCQRSPAGVAEPSTLRPPSSVSSEITEDPWKRGQLLLGFPQPDTKASFTQGTCTAIVARRAPVTGRMTGRQDDRHAQEVTDTESTEEAILHTPRHVYLCSSRGG